MLKFALYASNHGFGHASRIAALAEELGRFGVYCIIRTTRPDFIFDRLNPHSSEMSSCSLDFGVKHGQNLVPDLALTKEQLLSLFHNRQEIVAHEVDFLRAEKIDLVITDVPFLVIEACQYARVPVFAISNFDWVYIYKGLFAKDLDLRPVLNCIYGLYQLVDYAFRLPFSSAKSMMAFPKAESVGLLARKKTKYNDIRARFGIPPHKMILLSMFGGEGEPDFDMHKLCQAFPGIVISTNSIVVADNHILVKPDDDFLDLVHGADVILTKPGYSSFAEAVQFGKFILYFERANYPEEIVLVEGLETYSAKLKLDSLKLSIKTWKQIFSNLDISSKPRKIPNKNTAVAIRVLKKYLDLKCSKPIHAVVDMGTNNLNYVLCEGNTVIHKSYYTTGLGAGFKHETLKASSISQAKKTLATVLEFSLHLCSRTSIIATSISREAKNITLLSDWVNKKYDLEYTVISEAEEIALNKLAVESSMPNLGEFIAFDIGGGSTELIRSKGNSSSIALGLLKLRNCYKTHDERVKAIKDALNTVSENYLTPPNVVGIGLTVMFLAMIIRRRRYWTSDLHNSLIRKRDLVLLNQSIINGESAKFLPYVQEPFNLDILQLSIEFIILILDKIAVSEFLVCEYGISLGYIYDKKKNKNKRHHNR